MSEMKINRWIPIRRQFKVNFYLINNDGDVSDLSTVSLRWICQLNLNVVWRCICLVLSALCHQLITCVQEKMKKKTHEHYESWISDITCANCERKFNENEKLRDSTKFKCICKWFVSEHQLRMQYNEIDVNSVVDVLKQLLKFWIFSCRAIRSFSSIQVQTVQCIIWYNSI